MRVQTQNSKNQLSTICFKKAKLQSDFVEWLARSEGAASRLADEEWTGRGVRFNHVLDVDWTRSFHSPVRKYWRLETDANLCIFLPLCSGLHDSTGGDGVHYLVCVRGQV